MSRAAGRLAALILGVGVRAMAGWVCDGTRDTPAGGDDLGNHTATQDVDMAGFAIKGGTGTTSCVFIKGTSGVGAQTSPAVQLKTGIDGADARVTLLNNGRVGIGTTTPATTVDIAGDLSAVGQAKLYQGTWADPASGILAAAKVNAATTANIPFVGLAAGASGAAQVNKNTYAGYFYNVSTVSGTGKNYGLHVTGTENYFSGNVGIGTTPTVKLHVNGAIASGYTVPFQTVGPTDNLDVSGKNSIFVFAHDGPITIGGLAGGVAGQVLRIVRIAGSVYGVTLEHVEAEATQKIYLSSGADETLSTFGGWTLAYDGGGWTEVNDFRGLTGGAAGSTNAITPSGLVDISALLGAGGASLWTDDGDGTVSLTSTNTALPAVTITVPASMTADAKVFSIVRNAVNLFDVDEDGDVFLGNIAQANMLMDGRNLMGRWGTSVRGTLGFGGGTGNDINLVPGHTSGSVAIGSATLASATLAFGGSFGVTTGYIKGFPRGGGDVDGIPIVITGGDGGTGGTGNHTGGNLSLDGGAGAGTGARGVVTVPTSSVGIGTNAPASKLQVVGAISSGYTVAYTNAGPTDNLDVSLKNTIFVDASGGTVTIGGLAGGVAGQALDIVRVETANDVILEHNEAGGSQNIFLNTEGDETLSTYGGWRLRCNGTNWFEVAN